MTIENEEERKEDFERRRKEEATVKMLALLQEKQDDEAAMLLGNIKHKVFSFVIKSLGIKVIKLDKIKRKMFFM